MNPGDLRNRLDAIKKREKEARPRRSQADALPEGLSPPEAALAGGGWERLAPMVFRKTTVTENPLPDEISDFLLDEPCKSGSLVFYDTETTGLSGGAGNLVFLAGFGFRDGESFRTVQLMLTDFPGEPAFLSEISKYIRSDRIYVSYNGRSFDANILASRFAMNGMRATFGFQLDLLYPARRLWKNIIGGCSLGDIEEKILGKDRALDVPGSMVPDLYFDFMKRGDYRSIEGVAAHHLEDITSLAELLSVFEKIGAAPLAVRKVDRAGLASLLLPGRPSDAAAVLKAGFEAGSARAGRNLGLLYKRQGDYEAACGIWRSMWTGRRSVFAGIELAKHLEHRRRDPAAALAVTNELLQMERILIRGVLPDLKKRRERLERKVCSKGPEKS